MSEQAPSPHLGAQRRAQWSFAPLGCALVVCGIAIVWRLNELPLLEPDEGRNAEVAREMLEAGEWVLPAFHGIPYLDKPVLYFDAVQLSFAMLGIGEGAARLPSVIFAFVTAVATFCLGQLLLDTRKAVVAVAILASAPLFLGFARIVIFDMALACFVTWALVFVEAGRRGSQSGLPIAAAATALAVLTKGPVGLLLPFLGTLGLSLGQGRRLRLRSWLKPLPILLFLALLAPWLVAMESRNPGFLRYALEVETYERLTRPTFERTAPAWYYAPVLFLAMFPWSLAAAGSLPRWVRGLGFLRRPSPERGLLLAAGFMVVFFSLSTSKLPGYVLPALPLFVLLLGSEIVNAKERAENWGWTAGPSLIVIGAVLLLMVLGGAPIAVWLREPEALSPALRSLVVRGSLVTVAVGALLTLQKPFRRDWLAPTTLALWLPSMVFASTGPAVECAEEYSSRRLASEVRRSTGEEARIATVRCFRESLDFYLGRVVPLVTETGAEISSTYVQRNFDRIGWDTPGLWTERGLRRRVRRREVDVLITRDYRRPARGFCPFETVGAAILWVPSNDCRQLSLSGGMSERVGGPPDPR